MVVSRVRCGSRAAAKLPWLHVVADAERLRRARRYMTEAGAGVLLGGVIVWRRYADARRCFALRMRLRLQRRCSIAMRRRRCYEDAAAAAAAAAASL